ARNFHYGRGLHLVTSGLHRIGECYCGCKKTIGSASICGEPNREMQSVNRWRPAMSDLVVIEFPSEAKAEQVRQKLLDMQKEYLIDLGDAVIATKQPNGRVKLNQIYHPTAFGAATGTMWGMLVGLIFLMPVVGAAIGAASGAIGGAL